MTFMASAFSVDAIAWHRDPNSIPPERARLWNWVAEVPEGLTDAEAAMPSTPSSRQHRRRPWPPGASARNSTSLVMDLLIVPSMARVLVSIEALGAPMNDVPEDPRPPGLSLGKPEETWQARFADDFNRIARPITIAEPGRILLASSSLGQRLDKCRSKQDPQRFLSPGIALRLARALESASALRI
jgi:hypothetical protein